MPALPRAPAGVPAVAAVDLTGVALAAGFLLLARAMRRRALHGDRNSPWAEARRAA